MIEHESRQPERKFTFIYPPTVNWNGAIFQRPHQLFAEFARQGHFAIFTNKTDDGKGIFWTVNKNLCISNDLSKTLADPGIKAIMTDTEKIFWVSYPPTFSCRDMVVPDLTVFDYLDESVDEFSFWQDGLDECIKSSDVIFVVSRRLLELVDTRCPNKAFLVPNGADIRQFMQEDISIPKDMKRLKEAYRYVVGFTGSLESWIDFHLIKEMAQERPDWAFVLIGPENCDTCGVKDIPNVHFLGAKKYPELVNYVKNFDAGIIPFQVRDMTNSANPIKMYEYLAAGIPVVATPIRECAALAPYIRTAGTGKESVIKIEEAIKASKGEKQDYIKLATENSWTRRVEKIVSILKPITGPIQSAT